MKKLFLDVGGTHLRSELVEGEQAYFESVPSSEEGMFGYLQRKLAEHTDIGFIGISYAGQVDDGYILSSPNIVIDERAVQEKIESKYETRLEIDNDLNCAAMAEAEYWQSANIAVLYVGTGIGAAVVENGWLVRGSRNLSYEIGHIPYREAPFTCGCGRSNCIELFASGSGMGKWLDFCGSAESLNLSYLKMSADPQLRNVADTFETALLHAAGTLVTLANPELLVLGGGVIKENPYLVEMIREAIHTYALSASLDGMRIEMSVLENASLDGAKLLEGLRNG